MSNIIDLKNNVDLKLGDNAIALIAKTLQVAILTGTDVVDNLRMMCFTIDGEELNPTAEYAKSFNKNIDVMLEDALAMIDDSDSTGPAQEQQDWDEEAELAKLKASRKDYKSGLDDGSEDDTSWGKGVQSNTPDEEIDVEDW
jgi:hypothetical protein